MQTAHESYHLGTEGWGATLQKRTLGSGRQQAEHDPTVLQHQRGTTVSWAALTGTEPVHQKMVLSSSTQTLSDHHTTARVLCGVFDLPV